MVILGIDPSISHCGLAWLKDGKLMSSEVIRPAVPFFENDEHKDDRRLQIIYQAVKERLHERLIDRVALEGYSMGSQFSRELMGEVGGIIKLAMLNVGVPYDIWPVLTWRKHVLGSGKLAKDEVRLLAYQRYGIDLKDQHSLEAAMIAMCSYLTETGQVKPRPKKSRKSPLTAEEAVG